MAEDWRDHLKGAKFDMKAKRPTEAERLAGLTTPRERDSDETLQARAELAKLLLPTQPAPQPHPGGAIYNQSAANTHVARQVRTKELVDKLRDHDDREYHDKNRFSGRDL